MPQVPLGKEAYKRAYAGEPEIHLLNRFFEKDPTNLVEGATLLARPGTTGVKRFGSGPIRGFYTLPGAFGGDLFVVSGEELYRYSASGTVTAITGAILGEGDPSFAIMSGAGYTYLFIADGLLLQYYPGGTHAQGTLTVGGTPPAINSQVIEIGGTYFAWSATVNAGTPDGTVGNPFLALLGADDAESLANMGALLQFSGERGVTYSSTVGGPNPLVTLSAVTATTLEIAARSEYTAGNSISTTVTGSDLSWGGLTLSGGGTHALSGVEVPDGQGVVSLAEMASHVILVIANSQRFYWITPGSTTVDPLNFAEAESEPDEIVNAISVADQVWFLGLSSTEAWYATGQLDPAFAPNPGRAFARGVLDGTAVQVKDTVILVGQDGIVWQVGANAQRISTHGIEERIRLARAAEA